MATSEWRCGMTLIVRALINDLSDTQTYDDTRIQQLIIVASQLLKLEIDFLVTYTTNIIQLTISPDPFSLGDDAFINIVSLKTACLILEGELKVLAASSIRVHDGPSSIDLSDAYKNTKNLFDQISKDFERAKMAYVLGNMNEMKAILTPYAIPYNTYPAIMFG